MYKYVLVIYLIQVSRKHI
jgi:hypothetical protein